MNWRKGLPVTEKKGAKRGGEKKAVFLPMTDYSRILARESEIEGREEKKKLVMRYTPNGLKNSNWGR